MDTSINSSLGNIEVLSLQKQFLSNVAIGKSKYFKRE